MTDTPPAKRSSEPAVTTARSGAGLAPATMKLAVGKVRNVAAACGVSCQSCAQPARPNTLSVAPPASATLALAQLPSSARTTLPVRDA
jgi:hypothetical protein